MRKLQFSLEILSIADHTIEHRYLQFPKKQRYLQPMRHCHTVVMVIENFMYKISNKNILNWYMPTSYFNIPNDIRLLLLTLQSTILLLESWTKVTNNSPSDIVTIFPPSFSIWTRNILSIFSSHFFSSAWVVYKTKKIDKHNLCQKHMMNLRFLCCDVFICWMLIRLTKKLDFNMSHR